MKSNLFSLFILISWFLVVPPNPPDLSGNPSKDWYIKAAYPTAQECEVDRRHLKAEVKTAEGRALYEHDLAQSRDQQHDVTWPVHKFWSEHARCIRAITNLDPTEIDMVNKAMNQN